MDLVYLDNNATTAPAPEVVQAMHPYLAEFWGNPSSLHRFGQRARHAIDQARGQIAAMLNCADREILFTSGGTESLNTAIRGIYARRQPRRRIITTAVEHPAVLEICQALEKEGAQVIHLPVNAHGALDLDHFRFALDEQTALVSIMWANNETGVVFPVAQIAQICRAAKVPFHCDAVQAIGKVPVDAGECGADAMSLAAHKFHGPKGVGALYIRRGLQIPPLVIGGPQESRRRGGTENVAGIIGMGRAAQLVPDELRDMPRIAAMRDRLERAVLARIPETSVNGQTGARVSNTTNISFARLQAEAILLLLSEQGICASAGAACASGSLEPSHVIRAMGIPDHLAHGAVRFSLSRHTTDAQIDQALAVLPGVIERLRQVLPVG
jgi:cysteine desulfurase